MGVQVRFDSLGSLQFKLWALIVSAVAASRRQPLMLSASRRLYSQPPCSFHRELGRTIAHRSKRDELRAAMSLVRTGSTATDAVEKARGVWGKTHIRTTTSPTLKEDLEALTKEMKRRSDEQLAKGKTPLFRHVYHCS